MSLKLNIINKLHKGDKVKILIAYSSRTGNTEKIASSMKEGMSDHDVALQKVKETDPAVLKNYDIVFLGSGIYAGKVDRSIVDLVKKTEEYPPKFVLFCTHASVDAYQNGFKMVKKKIAGSTILGEWDCRGENLGMPKEAQEKMIANIPPEKQEQARKFNEALKGRPNAEDLESAKEYAKSIIDQ